MARELLHRIVDEGIKVDELLALLAFAVHEDTQPLMQARADGAQIETIGHRACQLKSRCEDALC